MNEVLTRNILRTERMALRPVRPSDAGLLRLYAGDARLARMTTSIPHPYPPGAAEAFIAGALSGKHREMVRVLDATPSDGAELIGLISARWHADGAVEIGYWVGPPFWNTGYASEAVLAMVEHLRAAGETRLIASVFQDNPVSARVITKAGFAYQGEGEAYSVARDGRVATWTYTLTEAGG
ncbi:GNAT family N-acetyltransferase [Oceanicella sp. SM1341]|uniref:GNAT family N-acetyltransferase n=1 Tax=Oceanicella sp. SM1341 TaxID=1548889 RepID=UPI000E4E36B3|nr:GNAT family N-acetyltransferase [Oceanicella sp. SM1341]